MAILYADLGSNVNADSQSASGAGTMGDPFNARAFYDRINGTGLNIDEYFVKGTAQRTFVNLFLRYTKLEAWDPAINGPYHILDKDAKLRMGDQAASVASGGLIKRTTGDIIMTIGAIKSCVIRAGKLRFDGSADRTIEGSSIEAVIENASGSRTLNCRDTYFKTFAQSGSGSVTINAVNCVFEQSKAVIEALTGGWTVNDTDCEFSVTYNESRPDYNDITDTQYAPDTAPTIGDSGTFTGYENGMFGNSRDAFDGAALGASFFPSPSSVGGVSGNVGMHTGLRLGL